VTVVQKQSVVTPQRFQQGLSYKDYIAQIKVNKDLFEKYYQSVQLTPQDVEFFRRGVRQAGGPAKVAVIGEDWCPDVYRGMPVIARIAEASGMELKVFPRDQNLDIMNEFLNQGQFQSIPTLVFYTQDMKYLAHFIERPERATKDMAEVRAKLAEELKGKSEDEVRATTRTRLAERYPLYQVWTVEALKEMLKPFVK
jgi:thiol-disulfide isomerase/thioredoxin